jgi:hypothetical protein
MLETRQHTTAIFVEQIIWQNHQHGLCIKTGKGKSVKENTDHCKTHNSCVLPSSRKTVLLFLKTLHVLALFMSHHQATQIHSQT